LVRREHVVDAIDTVERRDAIQITERVEQILGTETTEHVHSAIDTSKAIQRVERR